MRNTEKQFVDTKDIEKWCAPEEKHSKHTDDTRFRLMIALTIIMVLCFMLSAFSLILGYDVLFFISAFISAFLAGMVFERDNWT